MTNSIPNRRQEQIEAFAVGNLQATRRHGERIVTAPATDWARIEARTLRQGQAGPVDVRVEHQDPRDRLLMLYVVWVKCLPHQAGRRRLVERCIESCKAQIAARGLETDR